MFHLRKPSEQDLARIHERCRELPLSYREVGCTEGAAPAGYRMDIFRVRLGEGAAVFAQARQAVRDWHMLRLGWVEPCWLTAVVEEGALVGTLARVFGLWTVNVCRIVQVFDERLADEAAPVARFGFAYGTLPGHAECGEERFQVERHTADDSVWYDIRAVSKPGVWLARLGYPLTRRLQRRFGRDSMRAIAEAINVNRSEVASERSV